MDTATKQGLLERLGRGDVVICAAGIKSELERRGLLNIDILSSQLTGTMGYGDHIKLVYEDFIHCGSDVVVNCNGEDSLHGSQLVNLQMETARTVAIKSHALLAACVKPPGNLSTNQDNTFYRHIKNQVYIAREAMADFILAEDFKELGHALTALEVIKQYSEGMPVVMTMSGHCHDATDDGVSLSKALRTLEESGADVVGLGSGADPFTTIAALRQARKICNGPLAAIPDAYRSVSDDHCVPCTRKDVQDFSQQAREVGIQFVGLGDGGVPSDIRGIADDHSRHTPASKFSPDISRCNMFIANPTPTQAKRRLYQVTKSWLEYQASRLEKTS